MLSAMDMVSCVFAALSYIPAVGWLVVLLVRRQDRFAMFHLRQSIGLFLFLLAIILVWLAFSWVAAWLPFGMIASSASFALVIMAYIVGAVSWIVGIIYALLGRPIVMPFFGRHAAALRL